MISAAIFPVGQLDDETIDQVVSRALKSGLVACNAMTGPFRIAFFQRGRIPNGWACIGIVDKQTSQEPTCAA